VSWTVHAFGCVFFVQDQELGLCGFESLIPKPRIVDVTCWSLASGCWTQKRKDVKKGEEKTSYMLIILSWHSISDLFVKQLEKLNLIADSRKTNKQNSTFCVRLQAVKG
jgi:hypothetical protein